MQRWDLASVVCARQRQFGALRGEALAERNLRAMRGVFEFALRASESVPAERMPRTLPAERMPSYGLQDCRALPDTCAGSELPHFAVQVRFPSILSDAAPALDPETRTVEHSWYVKSAMLVVC